MARRWKAASTKIRKIAAGETGAKRAPVPGLGSSLMRGQRVDWSKPMVDSINSVLKVGELHAACTDAKLRKLAVLLIDRWDAERDKFSVAIATTDVSRLARKLKDLRDLDEGLQNCAHYSSFWNNALTLPDGDAAWCVKNYPQDCPFPDWLQGHAKIVFPGDWEMRIENLEKQVCPEE